MKSIYSALLIAALLIPGKLSAQTVYYAGTSQVSIEPDQTLHSLHLGGYGLPRNGRFSLEWSAVGSLPEVTTFGVSGADMYLVSRNELFRLVPEKSNVRIVKEGSAESMIAIAGFDGKLYGMNSGGEILETEIGRASCRERV